MPQLLKKHQMEEDLKQQDTIQVDHLPEELQEELDERRSDGLEDTVPLEEVKKRLLG